MIKTHNEVEIEEAFNVIKGMYGKPTADTMLNGKRLNTFPLRSGTRQ